MSIFHSIGEIAVHCREFYAYLMLREAVRKANKAFSQTGKRHYVVPSLGGRPRLLVMDRTNFRILKRKHYMNQQALTRDLMCGSFYFTPYCDGSGQITEAERRYKAQQCFLWYASETKEEKRRKKAEKKRKREEKKNGKIQCKG